FQRRYAVTGEQKDSKARFYRFSEGFYRATPGDISDFDKWLLSEIEMHGFQVVIIDDLAAFRQTLAGAREIVRVMRQLKRIKEQTGVSILVLSGLRGQRGRSVQGGEDGLLRWQVLSEIADSAFTINVSSKQPENHHVFQTRSRSGPIVWNSRNAPVCRIERAPTGFIGMSFDS